MSNFMQKQIVHGEWLEIETMNGTWFLPIEYAPKSVVEFCNSDQYPSEIANNMNARTELFEFVDCNHDYHIFSVEKIAGYGCRLSAPGYLDCTEWTVFRSENEARIHLSDMYDSE